MCLESIIKDERLIENGAVELRLLNSTIRIFRKQRGPADHFLTQLQIDFFIHAETILSECSNVQY